MMNSKPLAAGRRNTFKKGISLHDGRRNRQETSIQLRKSKKDEQLAKRRLMKGVSSTSLGGRVTNTNNTTTDPHAANGATTTTAIAENMQVLHTFMANPSAVPREQLLEAVKQIRRLLSVERNPPVDQIVKAGALPYLVRCLSKDDDHMLQFEAAWALTNIASTSRTKDVAQADGVVASLVKLLRSPSNDVREQAGWCIGNIAGDNVAYRDGLLHAPELVEGMVLNLQQPGTRSLAQNMAWAASNLCRGKPTPDLALVHPLIAPLVNFLQVSCDNFSDADVDLHTDTSWALSYLSDGDDDRIQAIMDTGVVPLLIQLIPKVNRTSMVPIVRTLGNFVTGNDEQTDAVIQAGFLEHAKRLLDLPSKTVRKDVCWILSNIAAGNNEQITALFLSRNTLVEKVVNLALDSPWDVRKEAVWCISNIITCGDDRHITVLAGGFKAINALCDIMSCQQDVKLLLAVLDAIEKLLERSESLDCQYDVLIDEHGGIDYLEALQEHPNDDVYEKSSGIVVRFFGGENEEDENLAPKQEDGTFSFGFPPKQLFPAGAEVASPRFNFGGMSGSNLSDSNINISEV